MRDTKIRHLLKLCFFSLLIFFYATEISAGEDESIFYRTFKEYSVRVLYTDDDLSTLIIKKNNMIIYETEDHPYGSTSMYIGHLEDHEGLISIGKDITGDVEPNLVVYEYTAGAHCCHLYHVFQLGENFRFIGTLNGGANEGLSFYDDNHDGILEFWTIDSTFEYWKTGPFWSPKPIVILEYDRGKYRLSKRCMYDPDLSKKDIETKAETARVNSFKSFEKYHEPDTIVWETMLDLIYSCRADLAKIYIDQAWPVHLSGKQEFIKEFIQQLAESPYYEDLRRLNQDDEYFFKKF